MLSLKEMTDLLKAEGLYKETIVNGHWSYTLPSVAAKVVPQSLAYDSRKVADGTLFFCKETTSIRSIWRMPLQLGPVLLCLNWFTTMSSALRLRRFLRSL
ncbi:MAG: hypothetical protein ACLSH6_04895 [Limosilactobacillus pontis]